MNGMISFKSGIKYLQNHSINQIIVAITNHEKKNEKNYLQNRDATDIL